MPSRSPPAWSRSTTLPFGASGILYQTVDSTWPQDGYGSLCSAVAPTVVPPTVAGGWMTIALARLSFGGGRGGSAAADGLRKMTVVATTKAARNMCHTLELS